MSTGEHRHEMGCAGHSRWTWFFVAFAVLALVLLWQEHRVHMLGILPYLILLACPLIHLFMHGGHGRRGPHGEDHHA
jgi:hypothetical protein